MKVSVITTVFNGARHFDRALPSILAQTHADFEYILVDDGSTDETVDFLRESARKDDRLKVFTPGRLGRAAALNYAVSKAQTDYIFQQDFDDASEPSRIKVQLDRFLQSNRIGVIGGSYYINDSVRNEIYRRSPPEAHEALVRMFSKCVPIAHTTAAFRKQAWLEAGGYPLYDDFEDLRLWVEIARKGWLFTSVEQIVGTHFIYPTSYWASSFNNSDRQKKLASVQKHAIRELGLPMTSYIYPLYRKFYQHLPTTMKRTVRQMMGMKETPR